MVYTKQKGIQVRNIYKSRVYYQLSRGKTAYETGSQLKTFFKEEVLFVQPNSIEIRCNTYIRFTDMNNDSRSIYLHEFALRRNR